MKKKFSDQIQIGQVFNFLTVTGRRVAPKGKKNATHMVCSCVCGTEKLALPAALVSGGIKSCGCRGHGLGDLIGQKVGDYTVIGKEQKRGRTNRVEVRWVCKCICGTTILRNTSWVKTSKNQRCVPCYLQKVSPGQQVGEIPNSYWTRAKAGAKSRGLEFEITPEQGWELFLEQNRQCALSGMRLEFSLLIKSGNISASFDRIDSSKGYIAGNVQWVHKDINRMKSDFHDSDFIRLCKMVANHQSCTHERDCLCQLV